MRSTSLLALSAALLSFVSSTAAKCCNMQNVHSECGDRTLDTPCCGWRKCNSACCACAGVRTVTYDATIPWGSTFYISKSILHAPPGVTWTCRDNMDRWVTDGPAFNAMAMPTNVPALEPPATAIAERADAPTTTPAPTSPNGAPLSEFMSEQYEESACDAMFEKASRGTGLISLEWYLEQFETALLEEDVRGDTEADVEKKKARRLMLIKHFGLRDVDGDGFLNKEESDALM